MATELEESHEKVGFGKPRLNSPTIPPWPFSCEHWPLVSSSVLLTITYIQILPQIIVFSIELSLEVLIHEIY